MARTTIAASRASQRQPLDLIDAKTACALIGGTRPISPPTLYRLVHRGVLPPPVKIGLRVSRWHRADIERAVEQLSAASVHNWSARC